MILTLLIMTITLSFVLVLAKSVTQYEDVSKLIDNHYPLWIAKKELIETILADDENFIWKEKNNYFANMSYFIEKNEHNQIVQCIINIEGVSNRFTLEIEKGIIVNIIEEW